MCWKTGLHCYRRVGGKSWLGSKWSNYSICSIPWHLCHFMVWISFLLMEIAFLFYLYIRKYKSPVMWETYISYQICCRVIYLVRTYSGYSGDLSPQLTLELLTGKENAVLIDVRPEARYDLYTLLSWWCYKIWILPT